MNMEQPIWWDYAIFDDNGLTDHLNEQATPEMQLAFEKYWTEKTENFMEKM